MPLTREFKETVQIRAERDPEFREELLKEGVECLLAGDLDAGKIILRDYINATVGFEELGSVTGKSPEEPDAHVRSGGEPSRPQPVRRHQSHSAARGCATRGECRSIVDGIRSTS